MIPALIFVGYIAVLALGFSAGWFTYRRRVQGAVWLNKQLDAARTAGRQEGREQARDALTPPSPHYYGRE